MDSKINFFYFFLKSDKSNIGISAKLPDLDRCVNIYIVLKQLDIMDKTEQTTESEMDEIDSMERCRHCGQELIDVEKIFCSRCHVRTYGGKVIIASEVHNALGRIYKSLDLFESPEHHENIVAIREKLWKVLEMVSK